MASLTKADEELIQRFIGLSTKDEDSVAIAVPDSAVTSTDWSLCLLARVITNRTVLDQPFYKTMMRAWGADSTTKVKAVNRNCYLIEFSNEVDMQQALLSGPWVYRRDLVALKQVNSYADLRPSFIEHTDVWVQFHNVPVNALTPEGVDIMVRQVGTPLLPPIEVFSQGRIHIRSRLLISVNDSVKDRVKITHPSLGELTIHCCYEKVNRICRFCGSLGHEMVSCADLMRLTMLAQSLAYAARFQNTGILKPKRGAWITDPNLLPGVNSPVAQNCSKRHFYSTGLQGEGADSPVQGLDEEGLRTEARPNGQITYLTSFLELHSAPRANCKRSRPAGPLAPAMDR